MDSNASVEAPPPIALAEEEAFQSALTKTLPHNVSADSGSYATMLAQLGGNQFFVAGFGLAALAATARVGLRGLKWAAETARHRMLVEVEITRHDEAYPWLLQWISAQYRTQGSVVAQRSSHPTLQSGADSRAGFLSKTIQRLLPGLHNLQIQTARVHRPDGSTHTRFSLIPGQGRHILRYGNAFIAVSRQRDKSFDMQTGTPFETVTLTTLYSQRNVFERLFKEAHQLAQRLREGKTIMYTAWGPDWRPFGEPKRKRPLNSVVLEQGVTERILEDVRSFLEARTWYLDRGIPYRRGYLLYGPPGTGKSSFIQALAGELDFNIAILNVSERGLTDDRLNHLLTKVPPRTIVLLEDADAAFLNRRVADEDGYAGANITFSGLLNAMDGVASAEERIIFLTTNHVERLDEALVRPGRVDMTVRLGEATREQIALLWDRFFAEHDDSEGSSKARFMSRVDTLNLADAVSPAALQGLFLYNKDNMDGAITMLDQLASAAPARTRKQA